ncbi:hypothetical protein R1flu_018003 [Riccia fluitans]|uniref:Uncharacterized protein n=1 Tax=Riccia fluitans TaxID=41844 RepID=A0ABD1ZEJ5_9MARC
MGKEASQQDIKKALQKGIQSVLFDYTFKQQHNDFPFDKEDDEDEQGGGDDEEEEKEEEEPEAKALDLQKMKEKGLAQSEEGYQSRKGLMLDKKLTTKKGKCLDETQQLDSEVEEEEEVPNPNRRMKKNQDRHAKMPKSPPRKTRSKKK